VNESFVTNKRHKFILVALPHSLATPRDLERKQATDQGAASERNQISLLVMPPLSEASTPHPYRTWR
jgi:hypothetical protein